MDYVTLYQVKSYLKLESLSTDDELLKGFIRWSSELIDYWKGRRFDIFHATYLFDTPSYPNSALGDFHSNEFTAVDRLFANKEIYLDVAKHDLLEVVELLNGDGTEIEDTDYILEPANYSKKNRIKIKRSSNIKWVTDEDGNYEQVISLTGIFGFNRNYQKCFVDTGIKLSEAIDTSVTSITIEDVSLPAKDFLSPRIQVGFMLKIDNEFMLVTDIVPGDYDDDEVELLRAYNGSEASAHNLNSVIYVYRPDGDIIQIALQLVRWRYRNKDVDNFDRTYNLATQTATTPSALPADVKLLLGARRPEL